MEEAITEVVAVTIVIVDAVEAEEGGTVISLTIVIDLATIPIMVVGDEYVLEIASVLAHLSSKTHRELCFGRFIPSSAGLESSSISASLNPLLKVKTFFNCVRWKQIQLEISMIWLTFCVLRTN